MDIREPTWVTESFLKLTKEETNIILHFCNTLNVICKCRENDKRCCSKYCFLCQNLLLPREYCTVVIEKSEKIHIGNDNFVNVTKTETVSVDTIIKYFNEINKKP